MSHYRIAVFASGTGSNFQTLVDAGKAGLLGGAKVELLVCDKPNAPVVQRAHDAGVPVHVFTPKSYASREAYEIEIVGQLETLNIELVVLAGYMRLLTTVMVEKYAGRLINIHPSLLPSFPGTNAILQALNYGVKLTGATVHFVDGGMDTGPIIAQQSIEIESNATVESLSQNIHDIERELYPRVVTWFAEGRVRLMDRQVTIISNS
ncbi:phosphoribosylglycinamide formyltransferase [Paenibacillus crassostreae]|uniref:Phosphoribosylglycinamide formyltransferase n=1 Tax=Paenibacillus crassostreae TaxID=1763538 RepID=A0A167AZS2_9BACL|nr:phosphoribosylglycinamide formyltransferase [Paenibacillus crassostreae]AOZ93578.1 phosphoribosylglycinamide formyltransferase [Paenibacillus crassostreae]OAB71611.1 phosphoribosylglycinamide formyltransferase [Paenibacillus crassostreae]